jgi:predicted transcriptional regulator
MKNSRTREATVADVMTKHFHFVDDSLDVHALAAYLLHHETSCAVVRNHAHKIVGFVSMTDLVRERFLDGVMHVDVEVDTTRPFAPGFHVEPSAAVTVKDIMMPFVLRLPVTESPERAAELMVLEGVHRLLVEDATGKTLGVVSALELLRWFSHIGRRSRRSTNAKLGVRLRRACEYALT